MRNVRLWCYACRVMAQRRDEQLALGLKLEPRFPYRPPKHRLPRSFNKTYSRDKENQRPAGHLPPNTTLQRHVRSNRNVHIPRFYYPQGKPTSEHQMEVALKKISAVFHQFPNQQVVKDKFHLVTKVPYCIGRVENHFGKTILSTSNRDSNLNLPVIGSLAYSESSVLDQAATEAVFIIQIFVYLFIVNLQACDCPLYWKMPLFVATGGEKLGHVESNTFLDFWKKLLLSCHDQASWFIHILTRGLRDHLTPDDLGAMVQDVVDSHPGLTFLKEATEFHSRYVHTVIARIFYCVNRSWSGRISLPELRRSNLLRVIQLLEEEEDINQVTSYFSYEHFYVIYCRFWELDRDHDLFIDRQDLHRHSEHALSTRIIERIFSGAVTRGARQQSDKMSYTEFVWFLLSEEDKTHPTAIEYWFRCMDLDGDGYLSMYELEYFYEEQLQRMEAIGIETLPFEDCLCQMLDMIHPATPGKISLSDLKQCKMTSIFFDTFFNLEKYLDHEQRDPFASQREHDTDGQEVKDYYKSRLSKTTSTTTTTTSGKRRPQAATSRKPPTTGTATNSTDGQHRSTTCNTRIMASPEATETVLSDWDRYAAEEYELLVAEEGGNDQQEDMMVDDEM
uniref:EF-hand domain-containing protein n=1 Tax=Timema monikensis TaxID=170555 RepID=A0A7R9DYD3_9NEOP|nr:unnamed protein product [Timema monikensis]